MTSTALRSISFVMPVLNEERYLRTAVESIFEQEYAGPVEVVLALGPSTDKTNAIAEALAAEGASKGQKISLVKNLSGTTSGGLNVAIAAATSDVVIRVDAHSKLSPGYAELAVQVLNETGAANVGGLMRAVGDAPFQSAVAWAYMSRFGLGGGAFHVGAAAGPADSVYLGVFRRKVLLEIGGFDEKILRGQDWQLNLRLREAGHTVWFDPRLEVEYHPRSSWSGLAKQFFDTGYWRGQLVRQKPGKANLRYFAPPLLVLFSAVGIVLGVLGLTALAGGSAATLLQLGFAPLSAYLVCVALIAVTAAERPKVKLDLTTRAALLLVLPTMHIWWGTGFLLSALPRTSKKQ
jgi:glycosyltransferase involved in cell wall biosynthesis